MDRYEPFTRSIDNRDGFQITRPVSPMRMMSDIERRMAENERKMAELADEEERLVCGIKYIWNDSSISETRIDHYLDFNDNFSIFFIEQYFESLFHNNLDYENLNHTHTDSSSPRDCLN